ncbi:hypothetical protein K2F54_02115 [Cryobacterium sp. 1639]|nr:hypothetical protein [Cryobacterium sp. 1639]MBX0298764.1 hypothetical protein [Cryobacterium sp. 1639]
MELNGVLGRIAGLLIENVLYCWVLCCWVIAVFQHVASAATNVRSLEH